jgi:GGDEF domain-containing protein
MSSTHHGIPLFELAEAADQSITVTPAPTSAGSTALLPPRAVVLDRLAALMPATDERPATLLVVGLRRRDDGWPIPAAALSEVTALVARELRADDWLGLSGSTEFAVLVGGPTVAAQAAARRLVDGLTAAAVHGMSASAGIAALAPGLAASEVLRRATLCLTTARTMGAAQVITYSGTR